MPDHYAALGVAPTATPDEIKRAFRKLASKNHPDKGGDTKKFQEIQAAYDVLGDAAKRSQYDNPQPQFGGFGGGPNFNANFDFNTIFDMKTDDLEGVLRNGHDCIINTSGIYAIDSKFKNPVFKALNIS